MCGLAGLFQMRGMREIDRALLTGMTDAMRHRGPDGDGFYFESAIGLGHRRLAVIDPDGGHQPMYNEDASVVIVFNGCIYNHVALRSELQALGHVFRSRCDTEAIIHAWEAWGVECLPRLSGMFAFALWDRNRQCLLLARDRLGKKPMHYTDLPDGTLAFASELSAFAALPVESRRIDPLAVDDFFAYGYIPDPRTIYQGFHKLPAGHFLLLAPDRPAPMPQPYWALSASQGDPARDEAECEAELRSHLRRCVSDRLIADVPLGAFLSGGVDSGAIVALAAALRPEPLDTFTVGFAGAGDERPFAAMVAARYGTAHHTGLADFDYIDAARAQARIFGEPFGDSSSVPTYAVCRLARQHATVALSGDGGDEVLGGYRRYQFHLLAEAVRAYIPAGLRRSVIGGLAHVYPKLDRAPRWLRAKHTLTEISLDSALGYYRTLCKVQNEQRRGLFCRSLATQLDGYDPGTRIAAIMAETDDADPLRQAQRVDLLTYLPGDILTKVDRTSMANSLEVRAPLLDHNLVSWGLGLPASLKVRHGAGKRLLKRAMAPLLPREILDRGKQGFATSLAGALRNGADRLRERLLGEYMRDCGLFDLDAVDQLIGQHRRREFDHSGALWLLLVFEGFLMNHFSNGLAYDPDQLSMAGRAPGHPDGGASAGRLSVMS